jgi:DHA1 family multidrug resistance protein-like MFS transporter
VALLSLGMALIAPNVTALVSKRGGEDKSGASLGMQNAANSLGQSVGPLLGGVLLLWHVNAPYLLTGGLLIALAALIAGKGLAARRAARERYVNSATT